MARLGRYLKDGSLLLAVSILGLLLVVLMMACGTTKAQWKTAGIDAGRCLAPAVVDSAGDALVALLDQASGEAVDFQSLGISLATKYGASAALCAAGKAWNDLGGTALLHGEPTRMRVAVAWLVGHQSEWLVSFRIHTEWDK